MKKILTAFFVLVLMAALSVSVLAAETVVETTITAPVLQSNPDKEIDALKSYTIDIPKGDVDVVQPIKISKKGKLYLAMFSNAPAQRYVELYSDKACTVPVDSGFKYIKSSEADLYSFFSAKAGTFYLKIYPQYASNVSTEAGNITFKPYVASAADRTLKSGTYTVGASSKLNQLTYYKISVTEAGYIGFHQKNPSGKTFNLELCDKSKMKIANAYVGGSNVYYPVKKGTYYIKTEGISYAYADWYRLKYTFYKQSSSAFTMTNNKAKNIAILGSSDFYLRIKAEKTGTLTLTNSANYGADVTLCNTKKTALSAEKYLSNATISYAVNKGTTYLLKVTDVVGGSFNLKYKIAGVSTGSNTTKAKAVTLAKGKAKKFNFIAGSTKSYWFKFKASASVAMNIDTIFAGIGNYDIVIYKGSKKEGTAASTPNHTYLYSTGKVTKGSTYYLKFTPQKLTTGTMTLKLNS